MFSGCDAFLVTGAWTCALITHCSSMRSRIVLGVCRTWSQAGHGNITAQRRAFEGNTSRESHGVTLDRGIPYRRATCKRPFTSRPADLPRPSIAGAPMTTSPELASGQKAWRSGGWKVPRWERCPHRRISSSRTITIPVTVSCTAASQASRRLNQPTRPMPRPISRATPGAGIMTNWL